MQQNRIRLTNPEAARTLRDSPVLHQFVNERNSSDVAKEMQMPANLVHHHVKRGVELGLLRETKREGKRIYYQLTAKEFTHSRNLLEPDEKLSRLMGSLTQSLLRAHGDYERAAEDGDDPDYAVMGFTDIGISGLPLKAREISGFPAHVQMRTLHLTAADYQRLMRQVANLINSATYDSRGNAKACTIALIGFEGPLRMGLDNLQETSSFLDAYEN